jgi:phosphoglycerate dehydrogenase-like enzyme
MTESLRILSHMPEALLGPVREAHPDVEIVEIPQAGPLEPGIEGDVLLTLAWGSANLAEVLERGVRWVHAYGTGVNAFPLEKLGGVPLSCSRGASAPAISEWVMAVLLAAEKQLPESWIDAPPDRWHTASLGSLHGRMLALVGLGGIAQAVARRALPFGMRVRALRRTPKPSPIAEVGIVTSLAALLADADHVVIAAPETKATRHLFDDDAFAAMKRGVHLVNVARGGLVDQEALRRALDGEIVGLATLDCVEPEPLPVGHWLYRHPRVRLSPHISWSAPDAYEGLIVPFVENLGRFRRGEPLAHLVDPEEGY